MSRAVRVLGRIAFGVGVAVALLASLFAAGEVFQDPGGWAAAGLVAALLVAMLGLTAAVYWWPSIAVWLMSAVLTLLAVAWVVSIVDAEGWARWTGDLGPVLGVATLAVVLPLSTLGLRRPLAAGLLLAGTAVLSYAAFVATVSDQPWRGIADSLTTSRTVLVVPVLLIGLLFLLAGLLLRRAGSGGGTGPPEPVAPTLAQRRGLRV